MARVGRNHIYTVYRVVKFNFFGSKGLIKFVKVLEPSNCFKGLMCIFGNKSLGSPHLQFFPISCVRLINNNRRRGPNGTMSSL